MPAPLGASCSNQHTRRMNHMTTEIFHSLDLHRARLRAQRVAIGLTLLSSVGTGIAASASAAPYDGSITGTYSCGEIAGNNLSRPPFSIAFGGRIEDSVISGGPLFGSEIVEVTTGEVSKSGLAAIKSEGQYVADAKRAWVTRFSGSVSEIEGKLVGTMFTKDGSTRVRDCVRTALAWASITEDVKDGRLNIDRLQEQQDGHRHGCHPRHPRGLTERRRAQLAEFLPHVI